MKYRPLLALLSALLLLCGCSAQPVQETTAPTKATDTGTVPVETSASTETVQSDTMADSSELFTDRDYRTDYAKDTAATILLTGDSAACESNAVTVSGSTVTITDEGTYLLSGTLDDGMIIVNADKQDKVQLVLNGVTLHSQTSAPIYVLQADKVFLTLAEASVNILSNGGSFAAIDENNIDAVIFSKEDLTMNGNGSLTVTSPAGHGIVSKDSLTVTGGNYTISCSSHGLSGKDSVCIANGAITVEAGKDGIHAENDEDAALGYVYIENGSFDITAEGDGISAGAWMQLQNGSFTILSGGGSSNAQKQTSDNWGGMAGGMMGGPMRPGGRPGGPNSGSNNDTASTEDSTSIKAIKAGGDLLINGGSFTLDAADDAVHSNANLTVNTGSFTIATGDDGFHADEALTVNSGTISVTTSYEGLEGLNIRICGGDLRIVSSDDGLNAAGGTDQSGFGGFRGNDQFSVSGSSDSFIDIAGGNLYINASGDGIDSNGKLEISGGNVTVCGPTQGDTAVLDYDSSGIITGGSFIGTGSYMMAQTFSQSSQGVISLSVGNQSAGTQITLADEKGNTVVSYAPELSFAIVILSTPEMVKGESYTVTVGSASGEFAAS